MKARQFGHMRRLSTCLSFYNPSVRKLLLCAVWVLLANAQTPHEYTLPPDKIAQAKAFAFVRDMIYFASTATTLAALALMVRYRTGAAIRARFGRFLFAAPILLFLITALALPWEIWGHAVSQRFGISVQGWGSWLWDWTKGELITLAIGTALAAGFYWLVRRSPRRWWFWAWVASLPLTVVTVFLAPLLIDPLFNSFLPLASTHPELVASIERILTRAGVAIPRDHLFEMIASDKTTALNAYVTGIGASKRVVLYDTIIRAEPADPLMTTFGHELGHYALGHIPKGIVFSAAVSFAAFLLCYALATRFARREELTNIASLPLLALIALALTFLADPVADAFSRWQEHQADVYSLDVTRGVLPNPGEAAAQAFQIEGERDLEDPSPNRFIVFWLYTHPPVADRLRFALQYHPLRPGGP